MKKPSKSSRVRIPVILVVLVLLGAAWGAYRFYPKQAEVFLITQSPLEYGETTLEGILLKDSKIDAPGNYILTTADNHVISLIVPNSDNLVGEKVRVSGFLNPSVDSESLPTMNGITEIITIEEE